MAIAALAIYAIWLVLAFGFRTVVQIRQTGDSGFRGLSRGGGVEAATGVGFAAALLTGFAAPIAALAGLDGVGALSATPVAIVGVVLACTGVAATLAAQMAMGDSWRIGVDPGEHTELVGGGVFATVRNPIYSAMALTALGLALMVPNVLSIIGFCALVVALQLQVRLVEEPHLRRVHGDTYRVYEETVGRFVPGIGCRPSVEAGR